MIFAIKPGTSLCSAEKRKTVFPRFFFALSIFLFHLFFPTAKSGPRLSFDKLNFAFDNAHQANRQLTNQTIM